MIHAYYYHVCGVRTNFRHIRVGSNEQTLFRESYDSTTIIIHNDNNNDNENGYGINQWKSKHHVRKMKRKFMFFLVLLSFLSTHIRKSVHVLVSFFYGLTSFRNDYCSCNCSCTCMPNNDIHTHQCVKVILLHIICICNIFHILFLYTLTNIRSYLYCAGAPKSSGVSFHYIWFHYRSVFTEISNSLSAEMHRIED